MSETALQALAIASSSDSIKWVDISRVLKMGNADFQSIKSVGKITDLQGALSVAPLRPDLLGWALAIQVFQTSSPDALKPLASLAWVTEFFDTGRFIQLATAHGKQHHPWVKALHFAPDELIPALSRAKAATNAVSDYGSAQNWDAMAAELAVSGAIAQRFSDNPEIQLERAKAATNAVGRYGSAQNWDAMAAELAVSGAIAQRFAENPEIQLRYARCLLARVISFRSREMNADAAVEQLSACLEQHKYLMEMAPFNQMGRRTK